MQKTVIIADDHPFTAEGMETTLAAMPQITVKGIAKNGIEAIGLIKRVKPDCALLDFSMPGANGLEVFLEAKRWSPDTRFVIITGISASPVFHKLYEAGIDGLFVKNDPLEEITDGIMAVCNGQRSVSKSAQAAINSSLDNRKLSKRELQVLNALAKGQSNKVIAEHLGLSPKTINTHRTNLLRKMNVNSTASLLVAAIRAGVIDLT